MSGNPGDKALYRFFWRVGAPFRYRLAGTEQLQDAGPAIYIPNHLGALGPVMSILSIPVRFYPWVVEDMLDRRLAPPYLYDDFVHRAWHLSGRLGMAVGTAQSRISVPLLNGFGSVAVDYEQRRSLSAVRRSLALLVAGKSLLIFPENDRMPEDPETGIRPFRCGFIGLCSMYERATGRRLPIYPLAVHKGRKMITIGQPLFHGNQGDRHAEVRATCERLYQRVREQYLALEAGEAHVTGSAPGMGA